MSGFEDIAKFTVLLGIWAVLASPVLLSAFFIGRAIRRRGKNSRLVVVTFAVAVALLVAPVPTPIMTFFIPGGLALFGGYYAGVFGSDGFMSQMLPWVVVSMAATLTLVAAQIRR